MNSDQNLVVPSAVVATAARALTFMEGELTAQPPGNPLIQQELDAVRFARKTLSSAFPLTPAQVVADELEDMVAELAAHLLITTTVTPTTKKLVMQADRLLKSLETS